MRELGLVAPCARADPGAGTANNDIARPEYHALRYNFMDLLLAVAGSGPDAGTGRNKCISPCSLLPAGLSAQSSPGNHERARLYKDLMKRLPTATSGRRRTQQPVQGRELDVERRTQRAVPLDRVAPDLLIGAVGHAVQVGDVALQLRLAVTDRRRFEPGRDGVQTLQRVGRGTGRALESRTRFANTRDRKIDVSYQVAYAHVVIELLLHVGDCHAVTRDARIRLHDERLCLRPRCVAPRCGDGETNPVRTRHSRGTAATGGTRSTLTRTGIGKIPREAVQPLVLGDVDRTGAPARCILVLLLTALRFARALIRGSGRKGAHHCPARVEYVELHLALRLLREVVVDHRAGLRILRRRRAVPAC